MLEAKESGKEANPDTALGSGSQGKRGRGWCDN